jgi:hypothetical protein
VQRLLAQDFFFGQKSSPSVLRVYNKPKLKVFIKPYETPIIIHKTPTLITGNKDNSTYSIDRQNEILKSKPQ